MVVTLHNSDGSDQSFNVASLRLTIDGRPLDIEPQQSPSKLLLRLPDNEKGWQQFVVHHSAANVMIIEVVSHNRQQA